VAKGIDCRTTVVQVYVLTAEVLMFTQVCLHINSSRNSSQF
jgi:hypothetical protein